ncbi:MAG: hypothetical protein LBF87_03730 [Treponema sp.]|jgi:hypothetical protein|nr:hypothetical protein [Treponema sp.]
MNYERYWIEAQVVNNLLFLLIADVQNADSKAAYSIYSRGKERASCDMPGNDLLSIIFASISVNFGGGAPAPPGRGWIVFVFFFFYNFFFFVFFLF